MAYFRAIAEKMAPSSGGGGGGDSGGRVQGPRSLQSPFQRQIGYHSQLDVD